MRREDKKTSDKLRYLLIILLVAAFCSSCSKHDPTISFAPSIDLSNMEALKKFGKKMPYKAALIIPRNIRNFNGIHGKFYGTVIFGAEEVLMYFPVKLGNSTVELFEEGVEKLFSEVETIYEQEATIENLSKYFLIFKIDIQKPFVEEYISSIAWRGASNANSRYHANVNYIVSVYSPKRGDRMDGGFLINQFSGEGHITMVAAKSGQESIELPEYGHGLFTYYLLEGLKGEADKGGNGDKKVDIHELYRYVYEHVSDEAKSRNFSQNPKMDSQVEGDIIMAIVP